MEYSVRDELYARAIGWKELEYLKDESWEATRNEAEQDALRVLEKIKGILNDPALNDRECYQKIERIVAAFYANGMDTARHDW